MKCRAIVINAAALFRHRHRRSFLLDETLSKGEFRAALERNCGANFKHMAKSVKRINKIIMKVGRKIC